MPCCLAEAMKTLDLVPRLLFRPSLGRKNPAPLDRITAPLSRSLCTALFVTPS